MWTKFVNHMINKQKMVGILLKSCDLRLASKILFIKLHCKRKRKYFRKNLVLTISLNVFVVFVFLCRDSFIVIAKAYYRCHLLPLRLRIKICGCIYWTCQKNWQKELSNDRPNTGTEPHITIQHFIETNPNISTQHCIETNPVIRINLPSTSMANVSTLHSIKTFLLRRVRYSIL